MPKPYATDKYRCAESGLTDLAFGEFMQLTAAVLADSESGRKSNKQTDLTNHFEEAGYGVTYHEIRGYIRKHVGECGACRIAFEEEGQGAFDTAKLFSDDARGNE